MERNVRAPGGNDHAIAGAHLSRDIHAPGLLLACRREYRGGTAMSPLCSIVLALSLAGSPGDGGAQAGTKENLDLPFDAAAEGEDESAVEMVTFYELVYEADGVFFCCDRSGSMEERAKFTRLQQEVLRSIRQFSEKVEFAVVFFDTGMVCIPPSGRPLEATPAMKAMAEAMVLSTRPGKGTCALPALCAALNFANLSTASRKIIIYLSDGRNTCNDQDPEIYGSMVLKEVKRRNVHAVRINTIVIGPEGNVNERWMRQLAAENGGSCSRAAER
jgi:hypothetical protein